MTTNIKLPQGYKLIANYNDEIVLAQSLNEENPEPYVTWMVHDSGVHTGCYFRELSQAQRSFAERSFTNTELISENQEINAIKNHFIDCFIYQSNNPIIQNALKCVKQKELNI